MCRRDNKFRISGVRAGGFTLLEVMLAVAIVGTSLFALALAIGRCMDTAKITGNYTTAYDLLDAKFMEFSNETNFVMGTVSGAFDGDFSNFQWQREVTTDNSQIESLFQQTITVSWRDRGHMMDVSLASMLFNPNSGDAAGAGASQLKKTGSSNPGSR